MLGIILFSVCLLFVFSLVLSIFLGVTAATIALVVRMAATAIIPVSALVFLFWLMVGNLFLALVMASIFLFIANAIPDKKEKHK